MAKQKISDKLQAKFDKPQFHQGDAVFFIWLGQKQYGYVIGTKKTNWGIQYKIQNHMGRVYPCGIQIDGQTSYDCGYVFYEITKSIGTDECKRRLDDRIANKTASVSTNTRRPENETGNDIEHVSDNVRTTNTEDVNIQSGARSGSEDVVQSGNARVSKKHTRSRKVSKSDLDNAIEKQKNFLNGFIKK